MRGTRYLQETELTSEAARQRLNEGNRTFAALLRGFPDEAGLIRHLVPVDPRELGLLANEAARPPQHPRAIGRKMLAWISA